MPTAELVERAKRGETAAFAHLYHACVDQVGRQLYAIVGPDPELDDLVQQTFVQVHHSLPGFRGEARFDTWLYRVSINVALRHLKRRRRRAFWHEAASRARLGSTTASVTPETELIRKRQGDLLNDLLDELSPKQRLALLLYEVEGLTLAEIAERTGSPLFTIAARVRTARLQMRRKLARRLQEPELPSQPITAKSRV